MSAVPDDAEGSGEPGARWHGVARSRPTYRRGSPPRRAVAPQLAEIPRPADSFELKERRVDLPLPESPGASRPRLDLTPIPRRLARHGPARLWHELAVPPRMHGLRPHAKARSNLRRPDGNRLARRLGSPTRHGSIVAFSATPVKVSFMAHLRRQNPGAEGRSVMLRHQLFRRADLICAASHRSRGAFEASRRRRLGLSVGGLSSPQALRALAAERGVGRATLTTTVLEGWLARSRGKSKPTSRQPARRPG